VVADAVLQDALEEHGEFVGAAVAIFLGELHHRILDDVERTFVVANGVSRLPEGATLDGGEKIRQFALCCQRASFRKSGC
jgi:hypothetical protein